MADWVVLGPKKQKDLRVSNKSMQTSFPLGYSATWGVKHSKAMNTWKSGATASFCPAIILSPCLLNTAYQICLGLFSNSSSYGDTDTNDTIFSELQRQKASGHHFSNTCHTACTTHTTQTCYWWPLTAPLHLTQGGRHRQQSSKYNLSTR